MLKFALLMAVLFVRVNISKELVSLCYLTVLSLYCTGSHKLAKVMAIKCYNRDNSVSVGRHYYNLQY